MQPNDIQLASFYRAFFNITGIDFHQYKQDQLTRRMFGLVDLRKVGSWDELAKLVLTNADERQWFLDRLAINVTEVFRNPEHWSVLESMLRHDLLSNGKPLKAWSAGCSTGAEAYSLAAMLKVLAPGKMHKIRCTDIDQSALDQAQSGELFGTEFRDTPERYQRYFTKTQRGALVSNELKEFVQFEKHNLLGENYGTGFDLILCRNVLIYFVDEAKDQIYRRFFNALRPGGLLFLGGSERIFDTRDIGFETPKPYFYRKPLEEKKWLNAS